MKQLTLKIETCGNCPYISDKCALETDGKHQYWGTAYSCSKTDQKVTKELMPGNCPLPDKSNRLQLAINIMEQALDNMASGRWGAECVFSGKEVYEMTGNVVKAWDALKGEI